MVLLEALIALIVSVIVYWSLRTTRARLALILACSLIFTFFFGSLYAFYALLNTLAVYWAGKIIARRPSSKKLALQMAVIWLLGNLCFLKYSAALLKASPLIPVIPKVKELGLLLPIGFSYIIFRLVHYIAEVYKGKIVNTSFLDLSAYVLFFPTFLCGPIERFPVFYEQSRQPREIGSQIPHLNYSLFRIALGLVKKAFIADSIARVVMPVLISAQAHSRIAVILSVYGLMFRVYMDFSGYTDMALGVAGLFGYRIVENFNKPFLQKNIAMFWRNWHISLYTWIRDYFFLPIFGYAASPGKIYIGILASMLVFHLWHGLSLNFLGAAIYNSAGIFLWMAFRFAKKKVPALNRMQGNAFSGVLALLATFSFVSLGSVFLMFDMGGCLAVFARIFTWRA
ncbi:MAG: hypothetical protein PHH68_07755 [Candidatus Omnitrophica bacterium]|nr:hypothetical protein [Candidatus Omnitrophota bacterium]